MNSVPDAIFPSVDEFEIPILDIEKQADYVDAPVIGWGSAPRTSRMRGVWHFYTEDYKFDAVWSSPDKVLNSKAVAAVEVNFSTDDVMPYPVALYRIYQKRWLAKYWQTQKLLIFVDLNVSKTWEKYNLLGVPKGWSSYATKASDYDIESLERQFEIAKEHSMSEKLTMLVYSGGKKVRKFCQDKELVYIADSRNEARQLKKVEVS